MKIGRLTVCLGGLLFAVALLLRPGLVLAYPGDGFGIHAHIFNIDKALDTLKDLDRDADHDRGCHGDAAAASRTARDRDVGELGSAPQSLEWRSREVRSLVGDRAGLALFGAGLAFLQNMRRLARDAD